MMISVLISLALCAQTDASVTPAPIAEPAATTTAAPLRPALALDIPEFSSRFAASDDALAAAWQRAALSMGARRAEGFTPELNTSVGPFWGDAEVAGRAYLWHTGDPGVLRAGIERIFHPSSSAQPDGPVKTLSEYSLLWPHMLHTYYLHTGDTKYARTLAELALPQLTAHFAAARGVDGLLDPAKLPAWPQELLAGFSPESAAKPNAVLNAFYFHALTTMKVLAAELGLPSDEYSDAAAKLKQSFETAFWDLNANAYRDAAGVDTYSVLSNALALNFGLASPDRTAGILALVRRDGVNCADVFRPYVIEACLRAGDLQLAHDVLTFVQDASWDVSILYLLPEYVAGLGPAGFGWHGAQFTPHIPPRLDAFSLSVPLPQGRATMHYARDTGVRLILPPGVGAWVEAGIGEPVMVKNDLSHGRGEITAAQLELLDAKGWTTRIGDGLGVWVSIGEQTLRLIQYGQVVYQARCASSASGIGSEMNSLKTPLGWHKVTNKIGANAVRGQVFRSRQPTREVWQPGEQPAEDLVLTRVILLDGLEPGLNKGGSVDSFARNIYIHGTNDEARLGTPSSHGCIRLSNDDVIEVFDILPEGTLLLITAE